MPWLRSLSYSIDRINQQQRQQQGQHNPKGPTAPRPVYRPWRRLRGGFGTGLWPFRDGRTICGQGHCGCDSAVQAWLPWFVGLPKVCQTVPFPCRRFCLHRGQSDARESWPLVTVSHLKRKFRAGTWWPPSVGSAPKQMPGGQIIVGLRSLDIAQGRPPCPRWECHLGDALFSSRPCK